MHHHHHSSSKAKGIINITIPDPPVHAKQHSIPEKWKNEYRRNRALEEFVRKDLELWQSTHPEHGVSDPLDDFKVLGNNCGLIWEEELWSGSPDSTTIGINSYGKMVVENGSGGWLCIDDLSI
jgi:hypothetical protein